MSKIDLKQFVTDKTFIRKPRQFSFGTYEECKEMFIDAFTLTDLSIKKGEFQMLPEYKEVIEWLSLSEGKGLQMVGSNGRGKTAILKGVLPLIFLSRGYILKPINSTDIDNKTFPEYLRRTAFIGLDEVGKDRINNDYGTLKDPIESAIDHCEDTLKILIITSNLTKAQIIERYGIRTQSRLNRLCKVVVFKGEDLRK